MPIDVPIGYQGPIGPNGMLGQATAPPEIGQPGIIRLRLRAKDADAKEHIPNTRFRVWKLVMPREEIIREFEKKTGIPPGELVLDRTHERGTVAVDTRISEFGWLVTADPPGYAEQDILIDPPNEAQLAKRRIGKTIWFKKGAVAPPPVVPPPVVPPPPDDLRPGPYPPIVPDELPGWVIPVGIGVVAIGAYLMLRK